MPAEERSATLYVVGTPIGNLADLSPRARAVLAEADLVAAEDTRRARGLLSHVGVNVPLIAYHEHNEQERAAELVERLEHGVSIALIADAGMPLVSDPGFWLVRAARERGIAVVTVPGPSAALAALSVAGLPTDRFVFEGFLPRRAGARDERLRLLSQEARTIVLYEAVHRMPETLEALVAACGAQRRAVIARELTKVHEQVAGGTLAELVSALGDSIPLLGEFVIVLAGTSEQLGTDEARAKEIYRLLAAELPPGKAVSLTASITGLPRNAVYRLARIPPNPQTGSDSGL